MSEEPGPPPRLAVRQHQPVNSQPAWTHGLAAPSTESVPMSLRPARNIRMLTLPPHLRLARRWAGFSPLSMDRGLLRTRLRSAPRKISSLSSVPCGTGARVRTRRRRLGQHRPRTAPIPWARCPRCRRVVRQNPAGHARQLDQDSASQAMSAALARSTGLTPRTPRLFLSRVAPPARRWPRRRRVHLQRRHLGTRASQRPGLPTAVGCPSAPPARPTRSWRGRS